MTDRIRFALSPTREACGPFTPTATADGHDPRVYEDTVADSLGYRRLVNAPPEPRGEWEASE